MSGLVRYKNYMNRLAFTGFGAKDYDFLMALCSRSRDQGTKEVIFSFAELRRIAGYDAHRNVKTFENDLRRMNKKLTQVVCEVKTESESIMFVLFPTFKINKNTATLTISVNEQFRFILNEITNKFTQFELKEFVGLKSKYSKCLYRLLKQFKNTGTYFSRLVEFKKLMDISEKYTNKQITAQIINPSVVELQPYFKELHCEIQYEKKRGKPIKGYRFVFDPEKNTSNTFSYNNQQKIGGNSFFDFNLEQRPDIDYDEIAAKKIKKYMRRSKNINSILV